MASTTATYAAGDQQWRNVAKGEVSGSMCVVKSNNLLIDVLMFYTTVNAGDSVTERKEEENCLAVATAQVGNQDLACATQTGECVLSLEP